MNLKSELERKLDLVVGNLSRGCCDEMIRLFVNKYKWRCRNVVSMCDAIGKFMQIGSEWSVVSLPLRPAKRSDVEGVRRDCRGRSGLHGRGGLERILAIHCCAR